MLKNAKHVGRICIDCRALNTDQPPDNPGVIAFPPLIWLVNAVISVLVHLFIRLPIMRYNMCLVCGIVFIILAPTLALSALITMKAAGTNVDPGKPALDRKSTRLNSSHQIISYAVFCLKKKK